MSKLNDNAIWQFLGSLKLTVILLIAMIIVLSYGTYIEAQQGHEAAMMKAIGSLPMDALIVLFALNLAICTTLRAPYRIWHIPFLFTHLGILLTLGGTLISHTGAIEGQIILRTGDPQTTVAFEDAPGQKLEADLGFEIALDSFRVSYYPGTQMASDYVSFVRAYNPGGNELQTAQIRVNSPLERNGWSISQASFFPGDNRATILGARRDPGVPVVYSGFLIVTLGLAGVMFVKPWLKKKYKH